MLLPSDVARLVLGYLQEEGLSATSRAFIHESPNLKEYAEHSTEDGTIPACVFSIFGKGLTSILTDYVALRTKESNPQVPAMVSSLWKKLDFTLNQLKSLQHSPALSACQKVRSRGLANLARQKTLTNSSSGVSVSETISIVSTPQTSPCIVTHSTPVSFSGPIRLTPITAANPPSQESSRALNASKEPPVQVTEHRFNPAPTSPGRRKWKRSAVPAGASCSSRPVGTSGPSPEEETEEIADENFPQLVIQNARDKILGDRSLQEKLAENINKILASEPTPQSSKASANIVEPDQSIDEILGLQGEIHMSDDAIHDILEQTESDPAFQALFDLFEYNKSRGADGEPADGDISSSPDECDLPRPAESSVVKPSQSTESGIAQKEASDPASAKSISTERKTRKSAPLLKKIITSSRNSRIDTCSAHLLVAKEPHGGTSSSKRNEKSPHPDTGAPMDIDQPQANAAQTSDNVISGFSTCSTSIASSLTTLTAMVSETTNLSRPHDNKATQPSSTAVTKDSASSTLQSAPSSFPSSRQSPNIGQEAQIGSSCFVSTEASKTSTTVTTLSNCAAPGATSTAPLTTAASSVLSSPIPTPSTEQSASSKTSDDPNSVVSLKIIISDSQDESSADTALNQAVSSISGDKIPTIYLSSPAKPSSVIPGTPKANADEVAQAVSCLQRSETVIASPLTGTAQPQPSYIIQLPFDGAAAPPASFFLTTDVQNRQTILPTLLPKGQAIAPNQFGVTPQMQGFPAGSTFILPSPMKPMVLPLSVMGQNPLGNVQMMSNQLVAIPNSSVVQQLETVKPLPAGAGKQSSPSGPEKNTTKKVLPPSAPDQSAQMTSASPGSGHRRILRFESPGESQTSNADTSLSAQSSHPLSEPSSRTKPAILTGSKTKRRIETVRCSDTAKSPQKSTTSPLKQKDTAKKGFRKQELKINDKEPSTSDGKTNNSKSRKRSKSTDGRQNRAMNEDINTKANESHHSRSLSSDSSQKSANRKEKDTTEKGKSREGRTEKRGQETTSVTANKENELKGQEQSASSSATPAHASAQPKSSKAQSKTSALVKQAAVMLHDIQTLNSPSTPKDLSGQEESGSDCPKTPARTRKGRDGEGTPRQLVPPNGSDMPTCSPASEAGSESSINMAAHTLMILSRAAMSRTGTPLKNSLRQEGAVERSPTTAKNTKKRKQPTPTSSPPAKKEARRTPSKKKEKKKLTECFPQDLDVDKFLSSLHYDE